MTLEKMLRAFSITQVEIQSMVEVDTSAAEVQVHDE
jgi:hypothetical protein